MNMPNSSLFSQTTFYFFLFLFPIAGNSVRSWTSILYWSLFLCSLALLRSSVKFYKTISTHEKFILISILLIFASMLISSTLAGWNYPQIKGLDVQLRYLAFIPIYLAIRSNPKSLFWLTQGILIGSFVLLCQAIYDLQGMDRERAYGVYDSPGLFAFQALVFGLFLIKFFLQHNSRKRFIYLIGIVACLLALALSGSRSTYVTVFLSSIFLSIFFVRKRIRIFLITFFPITAALFYLTIPPVHEQIDKGISEVSAYIFNSQEDVNWEDGSVAARFAMWKAALVISKDNPLFGIGWRNFSETSKEYAKSGLVAPQAIGHPHPHNTYLEFLVTNGLIGLGLLCVFLILVFMFTPQKYDERDTSSVWLKVFILVFAINAINEGGALIYGNSTAFFFITFGILLASASKNQRSLKPRAD